LNIRLSFGAVVDADGHDMQVGSGVVDHHGDEIFEGAMIRCDDLLYEAKFLHGCFYAIGDGFGIPLSDLHRKCEILHHRRTRQ